MRLEFHPDTAKDVQDAVRYFENQRPGLADEFQLEVSEALDRICASPSRFPKIEANIRRCLVHRFPYSILYRIVAGKRIRILVIRHHRRHPKYGLTRI